MLSSKLDILATLEAGGWGVWIASAWLMKELVGGHGLDLGLFLSEGRGVTEILEPASLSLSLWSGAEAEGIGVPLLELSLQCI